MIWCPWRLTPARTTPRITALRPGQSPPPVRMPKRAIGRASCQMRATGPTRFDTDAARCRFRSADGGGLEHDAGLGLLDAELALERAQQRVELGRVATGHLQVVVEAAGHVGRVDDALHPRQRAF